MDQLQGILNVLSGGTPTRLPFIDRLNLWYGYHSLQGTLPRQYAHMSLRQIHRQVGLGYQKFSVPFAYRLKGVDIIVRFQGKQIFRQSDPEMEHFPGAETYPHIPKDKPGVTHLEFITPAGKLHMRFEMTEEMVRQRGILPYLRERPIKAAEDYRTVEYILERMEYLPRYDSFLEEVRSVGEDGLVIADIHRIPFQQVLLEYLGEVPLFFALRDEPRLVKKLMQLLHEITLDMLRQLSGLNAPYVEFVDNIDGMMTNPQLFREYCMPQFQRYSEILHNQGKKVGSHADGNLGSLLHLFAETGLDVCESFSPAPLTDCTFEAAWQAWQDGPLIWGGIPSTILEARTSEGEFQRFVDRLFNTIADKRIILGIGDQVMPTSLIDRVRYISARVESHPLR